MSLLDLVEAANADNMPGFGAPPQSVRLRDAGRMLALDDGQGGETAVRAGALRQACRCAWCTRARIDGVFPARFEALEIVAAELIGGYALRLHFSDGHDRGIFPWRFIREIAASAAAAPHMMETVDA